MAAVYKHGELKSWQNQIMKCLMTKNLKIYPINN